MNCWTGCSWSPTVISAGAPPIVNESVWISTCSFQDLLWAHWQLGPLIQGEGEGNGEKSPRAVLWVFTESSKASILCCVYLLHPWYVRDEANVRGGMKIRIIVLVLQALINRSKTFTQGKKIQMYPFTHSFIHTLIIRYSFSLLPSNTWLSALAFQVLWL